MLKCDCGQQSWLPLGVRHLIGLISRLDHQSGRFHDVRNRDTSVRGLDAPIRNGLSGQNSPTSAKHGTEGKLLVDHWLRFWARQVTPAPPHEGTTSPARI